MAPLIAVREANDTDSTGLLALSRGSVVNHGVRWAIQRNPDYFLPLRAEARDWWVLVAEDEDSGAIVGSVSVALREAYVAGRPRLTAYASRLAVHPDYRRRGIGDRLHRGAAAICERTLGEKGIVLSVVVEGNTLMRGRVRGPRGLPRFRPFGHVRVHLMRTRSVRGRSPGHRATVRPAEPSDLEAMAALGRRLFPERQFGPVFDADSLAAWIECAPGLELSDYLVAHESGALVGWFGLWKEDVVRQVRIAAYTPLARARKFVHDALTPVTRRPRFPVVGDLFRSAAVVHPCVPWNRPDLLRSMIIHAAARLHEEGCARLTVSLDPRDGLSRALRGLGRAGSCFGTYVATPAGHYTGPPLGDRPVHFEMALA